jgi:hypothetical protein
MNVLMDTTTIEKIDWTRVAQPQTDGYDAMVALQLAAEHGYTQKVSSIENAVQGFLSVRPMEYPNEVSVWCEQGPLEHPNIERALNLLRSWPEGFGQFQALMHTIYPIQNVKVSKAAFPNSGYHSSNLVLGSASHSEWKRFGSLYATLNDPIGTAQAFVHEMGHQKLRALGVHVEGPQGFITNEPGELFESPVRKDKLRPMTAIVHAAYSWIYIVQLDIRMLEEQKRQHDDATIVNLFAHYLKRNLPPLISGMQVINKNIRLNSEGEDFIEGFYHWYNDILDQVDALEIFSPTPPLPV